MLTIVNPASGATLREIPEDDAKAIQEKFQQAAKAQPLWAAQPLAKRQEVIATFSQALVTHRDRLADILSLEMGKPIVQARSEIAATPARLKFFLDHVETVLKPQRVWQEGLMTEEIHQEPLGVIGNISAWNYPYFVGTNVFVPALLTGNAVLYKPSEHATLTGLAMVDLLHESGVPKDVFIPIVGGGAVGALLLKEPLAGIFFTGSFATGKKIASAAALRLTKVQLELGGKDPAYATDDVDVNQVAAALAEGAFYNGGQSCCAVERIYVHENIAEAFEKEFVRVVKGFVVGLPSDEKTFIGPLARPDQIAVLENQVAEARAQGAKLLCGGRAIKPGNFFEPTVLGNVNSQMNVMREESFGPIIGIQVVSDDAHAIACMNDTDYGLTASVYCNTVARAEKILTQVNSGTAYINCCDRVSPRLPWSGRNHSGLGVTLGVEGIRTFLQPKAWHKKNPSV